MNPSRRKFILSGYVLACLLLFTVVYISIPNMQEADAQSSSDPSIGEQLRTAEDPSFSKFFGPNEYPLIIQNINYTIDDFAAKKTTILKVGEPTQIKVLVSDDGGGADIKRISVYMNLNDASQGLSDSNTALSYNYRGEPTIRNSEGIIDTFSVTTTPDGLKQLATFDITFAKEMQLSDVIIQALDEVSNDVQLRATHAIEVIKSESIEEEQPEDEKVDLDKITEEIPEIVPTWIKQRTKAWATDSSSDAGFAQGLTGMINENILHVSDSRITAKDTSEISFEVPQWVKNNAKWWTEDMISETEFVNAIQFLLDNNHIKLKN